MKDRSHDGCFITFEGPDGSGKSTQIKRLAKLLEKLKLNVLQTREPGGTEIGERVRNVVHDLRSRSMELQTEVLLYSGSRAQLVRERTHPHLRGGGIVLCDRYVDSTIAYQGYGRGIDIEVLRVITEFATGGLMPDLTLLLDLDPEIGLQRRLLLGGEWNRMDDMALEFHKRVRDGYLEIARKEPDRFVVIDANRSIDEIYSDTEKITLSRLRAIGFLGSTLQQNV